MTTSRTIRMTSFWSVVTAAVFAAGCGPAKPQVILDTPTNYPAKCGDRTLYHTPQGYIYARSETAAGEADTWLKEVKKYVKQEYKRDLGKGIVVVMDPVDQPVARTIEEELVMERDPSIMPTQPRRPKTPEELRKKMADQGVPEAPMVRGTPLPLTPAKLRQMGLGVPPASWAVAAPSHELAVECGTDVGAGALHKKKPDWTPEQAKKAASMFGSSFAKAFEISRGDAVFMLWAQQQKDWSDEQRRNAILKRQRYTCQSNWLPAPKDEDLEW
ncbi:MAG TPA: hypothetical protein VMV94_06750 [Phycisphaerae bacterium]|nr:hypothetical protein [Phycisphaerae bacterium]